MYGICQYCLTGQLLYFMLDISYAETIHEKYQVLFPRKSITIWSLILPSAAVETGALLIKFKPVPFCPLSPWSMTNWQSSGTECLMTIFSAHPGDFFFSHDSIYNSNYLLACWVILQVFWCRLLIFSPKLTFLKKFFREYHQAVKQFGSRSGPTKCQAWSESKLFANIISRRY